MDGTKLNSFREGDAVCINGEWWAIVRARNGKLVTVSSSDPKRAPLSMHDAERAAKQARRPRGKGAEVRRRLRRIEKRLDETE